MITEHDFKPGSGDPSRPQGLRAGGHAWGRNRALQGAWPLGVLFRRGRGFKGGVGLGGVSLYPFLDPLLRACG